jgi:hypothetical protein
MSFVIHRPTRTVALCSIPIGYFKLDFLLTNSCPNSTPTLPQFIPKREFWTNWDELGQSWGGVGMTEKLTLKHPDEWIWADSTYTLDSWCITPYRKPHTTLAENSTFNYYLPCV